MSPTGLQVNKPFLFALVIGLSVCVYLWYRFSSPEVAKEVKMDAVDTAKLSVDTVTIEHNEKFTFKVDGKDVTIAYRQVKPASSKGDMLFLHGMRFKSETWVLPPIKTLQLMYNLNYRAVAIDLPGFGDSPKAEIADKRLFIEAVISALKLDRPVIVSPSMSGSYALPFLLTDPATADKRCRGYVPVAPVDTDKYKQADYQKFPVKTLIIYGAKDTSIGYTSRDNLKNIPSHEIVELPEAGHACYLDKPDAFHKNLLSFLESLEK